MNKIDLIIVGVLCSLLICGMIFLQAIDKEISDLVNVLTLLVGYFVGVKRDIIVGMAKVKFGKKNKK